MKKGRQSVDARRAKVLSMIRGRQKVKVQAGKAFMGCTGISPDGEILCGIPTELGINDWKDQHLCQLFSGEDRDHHHGRTGSRPYSGAAADDWNDGHSGRDSGFPGTSGRRFIRWAWAAVTGGTEAAVTAEAPGRGTGILPGKPAVILLGAPVRIREAGTGAPLNNRIREAAVWPYCGGEVFDGQQNFVSGFRWDTAE